MPSSEQDPHSVALPAGPGLDPADWSGLRAEAHRMLDDMLDHIATLAERPLWQPAPAEVRARFEAPLPLAPTPLGDVHADFLADILPYGSGNGHPGFMGWVQGGGTAAGMLGEMLAAGLNSNLGGRDHVPLDVERQIGRWMRDIFGFPAAADGLFLTGASQANFCALLAARTRALGGDVRRKGLPARLRLTAYASREAHGCIPRAMDMAGLGSGQLRQIPTDDDRRIDLDALRAAIIVDRAEGHLPFLLIGSAGTVNTGAIDDLDALADIATEFGLHYHVDGALGALGVLSPELKPLFHGIERADSLAFDFHKWAQVPYDAGFLLVADGSWLRAAFSSDAAYLTRADAGLAGGDWWPCDIGPDLSRGFRALKTWFTIRTYGLDQLGSAMVGTCRLAKLLADRVDAEPVLTRLAPVALNVVCFSYGNAPTEAGVAPRHSLNGRIVERLHLEGSVAPSLTLVDGRPAIRAAIVNHRTRADDIDRLVAGVLRVGREEAGRALA
ncbi:MAG: pyridoxal-dependent decarboxylase [Ancalomicrobiaceae bacterium]|nr:pyridoxal-dependent decarboxylase [Ancalomicrobiaceae bacterium]